MKAGSSEYETFIRSALKPFQALPFITSGASEKYKLDNKDFAGKDIYIKLGSQESNDDNYRFKGRTIIFKEQGQILLLKLAQALEDVGIVEHMPKLEGKKMIMIISPKRNK